MFFDSTETGVYLVIEEWKRRNKSELSNQQWAAESVNRFGYGNPHPITFLCDSQISRIRCWFKQSTEVAFRVFPGYSSDKLVNKLMQEAMALGGASVLRIHLVTTTFVLCIGSVDCFCRMTENTIWSIMKIVYRVKECNPNMTIYICELPVSSFHNCSTEVLYINWRLCDILCSLGAYENMFVEMGAVVLLL